MARRHACASQVAADAAVGTEFFAGFTISGRMPDHERMLFSAAAIARIGPDRATSRRRRTARTDFFDSMRPKLRSRVSSLFEGGGFALDVRANQHIVVWGGSIGSGSEQQQGVTVGNQLFAELNRPRSGGGSEVPRG